MAFGISIGAHIIILLLAAHIGIALTRSPEKDTPLEVTFRKPLDLPKPKPPEKKKKEIPIPKGKKKDEAPPKVPKPDPEKDPSIQPTDKPGEAGPKVRSKNKITQFTRNIIAPGQAGGDTENLLSGRNAHKRGMRLVEGGAPKGSEAGVLDALDWLAKHQDADGKWDPKNFTAHCPRNRECSGLSKFISSEARLGTTGIATLAYLSRGFTHDPGRRTRIDKKYALTVGKALKYILRNQQEDGSFREGGRIINYTNGICTLVLIESFALTGDKTLVEPINSGLRFMVNCQQDSGGWDYGTAMGNRNDTSVTSWVVLALKSARAIKCNAPWDTDFRLLRFLSEVTSDDGTAYYTNHTADTKNNHRNLALTSGTLMVRLYLGLDDSPMAHMQANLISNNPPYSSRLTVSAGKDHTYYYWYYGTLAVFAMGGEYWKQWNRPMANALLSKQSTRGHEFGSWDPAPSRWTNIFGGRVMSTAMAALDLEIYYRYLRATDKMRKQRLEELLLTGLDKENLEPADTVMLIKNLVFIDREKAIGAAYKQMSDEANLIPSRLQGAQLLARYNDPRVFKYLKSFISDEAFSNTETQLAAIRSMGMLGTKASLSMLIDLLDTEDPAFLTTCKRALFLATGSNYGFNVIEKTKMRKRIITGWRRRLEAMSDKLPDMRKERIYCEVGAVGRQSNHIYFDAGSLDGVKAGQMVTVTSEEYKTHTGRISFITKEISRAKLKVIPETLKVGDPAVISVKPLIKRKVISERKSKS